MLFRSFHIPLQSGSDAILKKMARPYTSAYFKERISIIKKVLPGIALTTDVMVGFPGESDEDFSNTLEVIKQTGFSKLHVFKYSPRQGTKAFELDGRINDGVKSERSMLLREYGERSREVFINSNIGSKHIVAVEKIDPVNEIVSGTSGNYIRIYFKTNLDFEKIRGRFIELTAVEKYRDGLFARQI